MVCNEHTAHNRDEPRRNRGAARRGAHKDRSNSGAITYLDESGYTFDSINGRHHPRCHPCLDSLFQSSLHVVYSLCITTDEVEG